MADTNLIYPYVYEGGKKAVANEVNANFEAVKAFSNGVNATLTDIKTAIVINYYILSFIFLYYFY